MQNHPAAQGIRSTLIGIIVNACLALIKGIAGLLGNSYVLCASNLHIVDVLVHIEPESFA